MTELEPSRDAELWREHAPWIALIEGLLGPVGAVSKFVRDQYLRTLSAAEQYGADAEHLAAAIDASPAIAALVVNALEAARRTRLEQKARAFGRAIAEGLGASDDAEVDVVQMIVRTIDVLEMPHIEAIKIID